MTNPHRRRPSVRIAAPAHRSWIGARAVLVTLAALLATCLALVAVGRIRLHADLATMLPNGAPVADAYRTFFEHFDGLELVFVAVEPTDATSADSGPTVDLVRVAAALEIELSRHPELTDVRAGLTEHDESFFLQYVAPRAPLLMDDAGLETVAQRLTPEAIRQRVARLRASLTTPAGAFHRRWAPNDPLGLAETLPAMRGVGGLPLDGWTSVFLSQDGDTALIVATPTAPEMDPAGGRAVATAIDEACDAVTAETGIAFRCRAVGGPLYAAQDERLLRHDLRRTILGSLIATSAVLILAFEGILLPIAVLVPLLVGLLWGAGLIGWWTPEISAISIGFGAVLIGLGVDYAIHLATRFRQLYSATGSRHQALSNAVAECGPGIATSALTTTAGFAVLGLARLQPLREVGSLVAVGVVMVLVALATVGGVMLVAVAPRMNAPGASWRRLGSMIDLAAGFATRRAGTIVALAVAGSLAAVWSLGSLEFNADPRALRPADPPARAVEALLADRFGVGLDTAHVLVAGGNQAEALDRTRAATAVLRASLPAGATLSSPSDYLAGGTHRERRLQALRALPFAEAADALEQALVNANLNPKAFATGLDALRAFARGEDPGPPPVQHWPSWLASALVSDHQVPDDPHAWASIAVRLPTGAWPSGPPATLEAALDSVAPGSVVIAAGALGEELQTMAAADLRRLSLLALAAVGLVVLVSFRGHVISSVLALLPVVLGTLWTLGAWAAVGRPLDLFCLAVLPILLGIGIDDGLHVMHGARSRPDVEPGSGIRSALHGAGRALLLTTLTTAAGFASLMLSDIPGLSNGGALIAAGVTACWLATLLVLPAIETLAHPRTHH